MFFILELYSFVTCGSALKLLNTDFGVRLHSHEVRYGSGSGQQVRVLVLKICCYYVCVYRHF